MSPSVWVPTCWDWGLVVHWEGLAARLPWALFLASLSQDHPASPGCVGPALGPESVWSLFAWAVLLLLVEFLLVAWYGCVGGPCAGLALWNAWGRYAKALRTHTSRA